MRRKALRFSALRSLVDAMAAGASLGEACERALAAFPDFDAGAALRRQVLGGTLLLPAVG